MALILAYITMVLFGGIALWIVAKLFSADLPPSLAQCFIGAGIAELVSLFKIPFLPSIVLFIILMKVGGLQAIPAALASLIYTVIKLLLFGVIVAIFSGLFA